VPTFYAAFLASASAPRRDEVKLRFACRQARPCPDRHRPTLARAYGVEIPGRPRLDRDADIFLQPVGEVKYGNTGKPVGGAGMTSGSWTTRVRWGEGARWAN